MDGNHDFPARTFCLAIRKKILEQPLCAKFQKPSGTEEITDTKGGVSRFSVEIFLCNGAENFQRGILLCITKSLGLNFGSRESLGKRKGGRESRISGQIVLSRNTETIRKGTLLSCVSVKLLVAKTFMDTLEEYQNFPREVFRLTLRKKLVKGSCSVSLISENDNFFPGRVMSRVFVGDFLSRGTQKLHEGNLL